MVTFLRLAAMWNLKSYQIFLYLLHQNPCCMFSGSFSHVWFCNFMYWSFFEKYWFTELWNIAISTFVNIFIESEAILVLGVRLTVLPNSNFHLKAWILSLATNPVSCFPWRGRLTLFIFKMFAKYPSLDNHNLCMAVTSWNDVPWKKVVSSSHIP